MTPDAFTVIFVSKPIFHSKGHDTMNFNNIPIATMNPTVMQAEELIDELRNAALRVQDAIEQDAVAHARSHDAAETLRARGGSRTGNARQSPWLKWVRVS